MYRDLLRYVQAQTTRRNLDCSICALCTATVVLKLLYFEIHQYSSSKYCIKVHSCYAKHYIFPALNCTSAHRGKWGTVAVAQNKLSGANDVFDLRTSSSSYTRQFVFHQEVKTWAKIGMPYVFSTTVVLLYCQMQIFLFGLSSIV